MRNTISLLSLFLALSIFSCTNAQTAEGVITKNISATEFAEKIVNLDNEQILDVRTPNEWATGVIEDAIKINVSDREFASKVEKLDKDKPVLVYCLSGGRSGRAMKIMAGLGFKEIYNMSGGISAWKAAKNPVVK